MTGPAEREWDRLARRYAAVCRVVAAVGCGSLGLLLVPGGERLAAGTATAGLILWTCGFALLIQRTTAWWPVLPDLAFLAVFTVSQVTYVPAASTSDGSGWLLAMLSMAVVTYQWHTPPALGALAAVVLLSAYLLGTEPAVLAAHGHDEAWLSTALWTLVEATLSRSFCVLIRRGGKLADAALAEREKVRLAMAISRARRSDELAYLADLHDTAAATFLMIGSRAFAPQPARGAWAGDQVAWPAVQIAEQALRDLRVLRGDDAVGQGGDLWGADNGNDNGSGSGRPGPVRENGSGLVDLAALLTALLPEVDLVVTHDLGGTRFPREVLLLPGPAEMIRDCVREALTNVARHAGTGRATLSLQAESSRVTVEVSDHGRGFDPQQVSAQHRGIRESITARMHRTGGAGLVTSAPGQGTVVRLEWPAALGHPDD